MESFHSKAFGEEVVQYEITRMEIEIPFNRVAQGHR